MCVCAQITDTVIQANTHKEFPYEQISNLKLIMNKTMTDKRNLEEPYYFSFGWLLVLYKKKLFNIFNKPFIFCEQLFSLYLATLSRQDSQYLKNTSRNSDNQ